MPSRLTTRYAVTAAVAILALAGCGGPSTPTTAASSTPSATKPVSGSPSSTPPASTPAPSATCAQATYAELSDEQRVGQLLMVGFDTNATLDSLNDEIGSQHIGNVIYLGGWEGADKVRSTSAHLQKLTSTQATGGIGLIIAADQEGGEVHQLRGVGFTRPPSASQQAQLTPDELTTQATQWARELKDAGVNVNLAPVTDTVPADIGRANEPIGKWGRQYGSTPRTVSRAATAFLKGMLAGGVEGTVKHFPGLGRIRGNTDFTTAGITDDVATVDDPFLGPFKDGIDAGAGLVMVSSARYPKLDAKNAAMFSPAIIDGLLRGRMGYTGVVITDDLNAAAARTLSPADRALRYISAGGDILLVGDPSVGTTMLTALATSATNSPALTTKIEASVLRVLTLKDRMGLLPCSTPAQ